MLEQIKKTLSILLIVCFLMSVTAAAASAHGGGWGGLPLRSSIYIHGTSFSPCSPRSSAPIVTCWPAQASAAAVSAGSAVVKEKKKVTSKAVSTRPTMIKETKNATAEAVSAHGSIWRDECDCGCECDCRCGSFIDTFIEIFIHCLPCPENCTSENITF
jgi:hypothetical protein